MDELPNYATHMKWVLTNDIGGTYIVANRISTDAGGRSAERPSQFLRLLVCSSDGGVSCRLVRLLEIARPECPQKASVAGQHGVALSPRATIRACARGLGMPFCFPTHLFEPK